MVVSQAGPGGYLVVGACLFFLFVEKKLTKKNEILLKAFAASNRLKMQFFFRLPVPGSFLMTLYFQGTLVEYLSKYIYTLKRT
jgi:hypothetical protein